MMIMQQYSIYSHSKMRIMQAVVVAVATTAMLLLSSCQKTRTAVQGEYGVSIMIDSGSPDTKAIADEAIESIVIYAFSGVNLVGYHYQDNLAAGTNTFPMTISASGPVDFYVIANPNPNFFWIVEPNGENSTSSVNFTANPPQGITPATLQSYRVALNPDSNTKPTDGNPWYVPMTNLSDESGVANRRFYIAPEAQNLVIPIRVTRAVSKVKMLFVRPATYEDNRTSLPIGYYRVNSITLNQYVNQTPLFEGLSETSSEVKQTTIYHKNSNTTANGTIEQNESGYIDSTFSYINGSVPSWCYDGSSEGRFQSFGEFYIFPNIFGGTSTRATQVTINYYEGRNGDIVKTINLPVIERNNEVRVWCVLAGADFDIIFIVADWDEEVTVDVPAFE